MSSYLLMAILSDLTKIPQLLDAWQGAGVPGVTITESVGGFRARTWLERSGLPIPAAVRGLFQAEDVRARVLMAAVDSEEILERAIAEAERIMGPLDQPHSGVLLAWPLTIARGIRKTAHEQPITPPEPVPIEPRMVTRRTRVGDVFPQFGLQPALVRESDTLDDAARMMVKQARAHCACVVNDEGRLVGLLPLETVTDDIFVHIVPEEFLSHITDLEEVERFAQRSAARRVKDAMIPPVWVKPDDTVQEAFRRMHEAKVHGIPVVDDQYRVIGYINLLELLDVWLTAEDAQKKKGESETS
ncbi:MAG: hypothetical protein Kow0047_14990 [Anaerolineae bacterium]